MLALTQNGPFHIERSKCSWCSVCTAHYVGFLQIQHTTVLEMILYFPFYNHPLFSSSTTTYRFVSFTLGTCVFWVVRLLLRAVLMLIPHIKYYANSVAPLPILYVFKSRSELIFPGIL